MTLMTDSAPIYITGTFRSGSTLASQIVNAHPDVSLTYDSVKFLRFCHGKYDPIQEPSNLRSLVNEVHNRINERHGMSINIDAVVSKFSILNDYTYACVYDELMRNASFYGKRTSIWGEKVNLSWRSIPEFYEMFPNGRVLHIIRDPRGVLSSWRSFTHAPGTDYLDMVFNCIDSMQYAERYREQFASKRYHVIRYEDLVRDPREEVELLCQSLELEFHSDMIDVAKFTDRAGNPWKSNSEFDGKVEGISDAAVATWKTKLADWEVEFIEYFCGEVMSQYNYEKRKMALTDEQLQRIRDKAMSSGLVAQSALTFLIEGKGVEQFPLNPFDAKTWDRRLK